MNLERFKYDFNLASTKTVTSIEEQCQAINNGCKLPINFENCTSFYNLINEFNKAYQEYLPTLEVLKPILKKFSARTRYGFYRQYENDKAYFAFEAINPQSSIFPEDWAAIYIAKDDENYSVMASNNLPYADKRRKTLEVTTIKQEDIKTLMSIIGNYHLILGAFSKFKNEFLFGNGTTVIFTKIKGEIFEQLDTFNLTFGNQYFNTSDFIDIKFKLGTELKILYDESKVILHDLEITNKSEKNKIINDLLNGLSVNNEYLPPLYHHHKEENKVLRKKDKNEI